ncbi:uncharacterized protein EURHEDRAFT_529910 [Aspergillus ruber CBS 135680]|uniref:C2H2-type domain-containing protein n=1 Tax=Aspergillus ruber (strain CBS 135680) TaxID=1388766 RepID=A0A017SIJ5_ASPRC|nr:uncharacterized protein EURHEDRAFT_529910 [Aspergillus ruber CBS 135680]EYE96484.1 hypothetical protein EURHEDRAFT_529910 [Aspergillus ruber CBS 135680]
MPSNLGRPFGCDQCPKVFTRSENLQRHKRARHGGASLKDFQCAGCQARFSRRDVYKRHSGRCRALLSSGQESQPEVPWEPTPQIDVDIAPSLVVMDQSSMNPVMITQAFTYATELLQYSSPSSATHSDSEERHIKAYFEHFYPSVPLLHRPTFALFSTPRLLVKATAVIGSLLSSQPEDCAHWRQETWESGQNELRHMVSYDLSEIRQLWVLQAWLLHIIYGAVREIGLSQQEIAMPDSQSWVYQCDLNSPVDDSKTLYARWISYINVESTRLSLYTLFFLDSQTFTSCNARPLMSPMELGWELPFPSGLWEARDSQIWLQRVNEHLGHSTYTMPNDFLHGPRGPATTSLSIATQQLMTEAPSPELLAALEASPFAAFCVLANLNALVRDFTRCYYQMPPSASDPFAFHILTQSQNKQIHTAIRAIARIVKGQAYTSDSSQFHLWRMIELFISSLRISLCRPDQLFIGGIVDNSLISGMAASTHLTQRNYVAIRRSVSIVPQHLGADEGILALLNDLSGALSRISGENQEQVIYETPWTTVTSYGILLCIWGALRRATTDIRHHLDTFNELPRTSESCMLIFNSLMESALLSLSAENDRTPRDPRLWRTDRSVFTSLLEGGESFFIGLMKRFCVRRCPWGIGSSMLAVLGEIPDPSPSE